MITSRRKPELSQINSLTADQLAMLPAYIEKWLQIGLDTSPCDRVAAGAAIGRAYEIAGLDVPPCVYWMKSPFGALMLYAFLRNAQSIKVEAQVRAQVWDQVEAQVWAQVWDQVGAQVGDQVWAQVWAQVNNFCFGAHGANWLSFLDFFAQECGLGFIQKVQPFMDIAINCGWWLPYKNVVIASEKPCEIHLRDKRLHRDHGPAILYRDGYSVWALNGVRVSQIVAETDAVSLSPSLLLSEKNAEVRREIVRKIGVDRVYTELGGKELDSWGNYSLITLDLQDGRHRPYLKMLNPSIGTWHIEGVHPNCRTVMDALEWRNVTKEIPEVLT